MLKDKQKGQAFLIVLLVTVIALTVGLSVASRNIVTLRTSREEVSSQKALAAAEAGIEQVLKSGTAKAGSLTGANYTATPTNVVGAQFLVNGGNVVPKDEGADIWLVEHDGPGGTPNYSTSWTGNLRIYWGLPSDVCDPNPAVNTMAALEVAVVSGTVASPVLTRDTYDPCAARASTNNFSVPSSGAFTVGNKTFSYSTVAISITSGFLVRVVPLYASSSMGVTGHDAALNPLALPTQGIFVEAIGVSSGTTRKLNVFRGYPSLPSPFFLYGLFSP